MASRHMWAFFCDDIRLEVGNKVSYMGVYGPEILVPAFPATFPKLCASVQVRTLGNDPFERLVVRILKDDAEIARVEISADQLAGMAEGAKPVGEEGYIAAGFMYQFSPLILEQPCSLRFRAETERETLKGGSVQVKLMAGAPIVQQEQPH